MWLHVEEEIGWFCTASLPHVQCVVVRVVITPGTSSAVSTHHAAVTCLDIIFCCNKVTTTHQCLAFCWHKKFSWLMNWLLFKRNKWRQVVDLSVYKMFTSFYWVLYEGVVLQFKLEWWLLMCTNKHSLLGIKTCAQRNTNNVLIIWRC